MYQLHGELGEWPAASDFSTLPKVQKQHLNGVWKSSLNCLSLHLVYFTTLTWSCDNQESRYMDGSVWEKYGRESNIQAVTGGCSLKVVTTLGTAKTFSSLPYLCCCLCLWNPLHSYPGIFSGEPCNSSLDVSSAMCDRAANWPGSSNQVRRSTVKRKKEPYSLTPMYLSVLSKGGMGDYRKDLKLNWDILACISPTMRVAWRWHGRTLAHMCNLNRSGFCIINMHWMQGRKPAHSLRMLLGPSRISLGTTSKINSSCP